jgi:glycosyltransferase involved in cell wall biosynthesis
MTHGDDVRPHVVQVLGDFGLGGDGRVARDLSAALAGRGARATCIALRSGGRAAPAGGTFTVIHLPADHGVRSLVRAAVGLRGIVAREAPDLLHVHGPQSLVFVVLALTGLRGRPPLWFTWHDSGAVLGMGPVRDRVVRWAMRRCARLFGSSRSVAERLSLALRGRQPVEVFRNGVADAGATTGMDSSEPLVVWAARIVPPKDPLILVRALARLRGEGLRFRAVLAGSAPPHLAWLERQVRDLVTSSDLSDVVQMPGWIPDLSECWRTGAIAVQTSHTEGLSISLLESMMAGLAVVATDVGDTSVAVCDGTSALLVPSKDEEALCRALRRVLTDPELRKRLGAAARERALAEFSLDAMARQVLDRGAP